MNTVCNGLCFDESQYREVFYSKKQTRNSLVKVINYLPYFSTVIHFEPFHSSFMVTVSENG